MTVVSLFMFGNLDGLFNPKTIAVIGASELAEKVGGIALNNIKASGFKGKLFPVNPKVASFYPNVGSLPEVPDLAIIAIPAGLVVAELVECGEKGIKNVVIFSAGFREIGEEGAILEKQLIETATKYEMNILGPNCLGFASTNPPLNATFARVSDEVGNLKFITQSGALAASLFDWSRAKKVGFDSFVTIGNKSILNENDILNSWLPNLGQTDRIHPIGLYLESIANGEELVKIVQQITPNNPVFVLKPGKSSAAATAMKSHTGAIAGENRVFDTAATQIGAIRCQELGDFFDLAEAFAWRNAPEGPEMAIISNAGGPAVLTTDTIAESGLGIAKLGEETKNKLREYLPKMASVSNPVDVLGDALAVRFGEALETVLIDEKVNSVLVLLTPQMMTQINETAEIVGQLSNKYTKPVFCSFIGGEKIEGAEKILNSFKVPNYPYPERAVKTIAAMWKWQDWRKNRVLNIEENDVSINQDKLKEILEKAANDKQKTLDNQQGDKILSELGITTPKDKIVNSADEAVNFGNENGWPIVLKMSAPGLLHKSDVGGVATNIKNDEEARKSFDTMLAKIGDLLNDSITKIEIQAQQQIPGGVKVIFGIKRDPSFGIVFLFGAGGKYAEILDDHNLWLAPLSKESAKTLVTKSKVFKLLNGYRDDPAYELDQLYEIMVKIGQLANSCPEIEGIEINPIIVTHQGVFAVDPKVILKQSE